MVMEDVKEWALKTLIFSCPSRKGSSMTLALRVQKDKVQDLLQHLDGIDENINFTVEVECKGHIRFTDVLISRGQDGSISTGVYRKATYTDKHRSQEVSRQHPSNQGKIPLLFGCHQSQ